MKTLSTFELAVWRMSALGSNMKQIAMDLDSTESLVRSARQKIQRQNPTIRNLADMTRAAIRSGIITL